MAQALEDRCDGTPFARIGSPAEGEEALEASTRPYEALGGQLARVADDLARVAPRGEAHLRFPLLAQTLWLLELQISHEPGSLREGVKKRINAGRWRARSHTRHDRRSFWTNARAYAEGPLPAWAGATAVLSAGLANQLTTLFGVIAALGGLFVGSFHVLWLSRSWAGRRRYKWFRRQPYLMGGQPKNRPRDFLGFAVRVVETRQLAESHLASENGRNADPNVGAGSPGGAQRQSAEAEQAAEDLEHLLVNAFLEDLRQGHERRPWKVWRRVAFARTSYPVLLVEEVGARLVRRIEEVRAGTGTADPLLVVVTGTGEQEHLPVGAEAGELTAVVGPDRTREVWEQWQDRLARDRAVGSHRVLRIGLASGHAPYLEKARSASRGRRRPWLAHPGLPWLVMGVLVVASVTRVVATTTESCAPGIWRAPSGECVGISDGSFVFHPRIKNLLDEIHETNRKIIDSGRAYATVVYFSSLSLPAQATAAGQNLSSDSPGELAGIAVQQRRLAENSNDSSKLQMRVLLANAGDRYEYAGNVAQDLLGRIQDDPTIVGAIGFAESRKQVQDTIQQLSRRALPMISMTATFDDLGRAGPNDPYAPSFFPLAPPNSELAGTAARWAKEGVAKNGAGPGQSPVGPKRRAAVFMDGTVNDLYGKDLGRWFAGRFGQGAEPIYYAGAASIEPKVVEVCSQDKPPDLIFYAGRSPQFGTFVDAITKSRCHEITVMAGDTVTQYVNDHTQQLGRNNRLQLFYTPLASPSSWNTVDRQFRSDFYDRFREMLSSLGMEKLPTNQQPSKEYAALAADGADTLMRAAQTAYSSQHGPAADTPEAGVLDRGGVLLALEKLHAIDGDSGMVKLHGGEDGHHALNRPVLLVTVNKRGEQVVVRQCGQLYQQQRTSPQC